MSTYPALAVDTDSRHACDDCGWVGTAEELDDINDLWERLTAGGVTPSGQCPECGALAYPYDEQQEYVDSQGDHCPYCKKKNIMAHPITSENVGDGTFWQEVECHDCGKLWLDEYELKRFKEPPSIGKRTRRH